MALTMMLTLLLHVILLYTNTLPLCVLFTCSLFLSLLCCCRVVVLSLTFMSESLLFAAERAHTNTLA